MPSVHPHDGLRRLADLRLRGAGQSVRARVAWPDHVSGGGLPGLLVFPSAPSLESLERADELCARAGVVVLSPDDRFGAAAATLEWAGEHAAELDADSGRLAVAGGALAAALALRARDRGWPALARQVLIHPGLEPRSEPPSRFSGVAPATVVTAGRSDGDRRYVARLRQAGVEVEALRAEDPERVLGDVARSLRRALATGTRR